MPSFLISFWPNSVSFPTFWLTKTVSFHSPRLSLTYLKFQCYIDSNFASLFHPNTKHRSQLWLDWPEVDRRAGWSDFPITPLPFFHPPLLPSLWEWGWDRRKRTWTPPWLGRVAVLPDGGGSCCSAHCICSPGVWCGQTVAPTCSPGESSPPTSLSLILCQSRHPEKE